MKKIVVLCVLLLSGNLLALDVANYSYNNALDNDRSLELADFKKIENRNIFKNISSLKVLESGEVGINSIPILKVQSFVSVRGRGGDGYEITGAPFFIIGISAEKGNIINATFYLIKDIDLANSIANSYYQAGTYFLEGQDSPIIFIYDDQINSIIEQQGTEVAKNKEALDSINKNKQALVLNDGSGKVYLGFGLSEMDLGDFNTYNFNLGVNFSKYVAVEASFERNLARGLLDSIKESYNFFSLNPVLKLPFLNRNVFYVKGGLGYSSAKIKENGNNVDTIINLDGLIYNIGLGYELFLTKNNSIRLEWSQTDFIAPEIELRVKGISIKEDTNTDKMNRLNITYKYTF